MIDGAALVRLGIASSWAQPINDALALYEIDSPERAAPFLAQYAHETGGFTKLVENLNYSAAGLLATFKKYFTPDEATAYARQPERIANRAYANRMGNGDEASGDGWLYRGRGLPMLTGLANYRAFGKAIGVDVLNDPDLLIDPTYAVLAGGWYWASNGLNELADAGDFDQITRRIVGGPPYDSAGKPINGQADRLEWLRKVQSALA